MIEHILSLKLMYINKKNDFVSIFIEKISHFHTEHRYMLLHRKRVQFAKELGPKS